MGKYILENETVKLTFPDGEFVELKEELSQADSDYIGSFQGRAVTSAILERAITDWSFKDDEGVKLPLTKENKSGLRLKYLVAILKEINRLTDEAQEFIKKN